MGGLGREVGRDAARRGPGRQSLAGIEHKCLVLDFERQGSQGLDGINAAAAQKQEAGLVGFAVFEDVYQAGQIVLEQLARSSLPFHSGQNTGIRGGIDDPIHFGKRREIAGAADVAMDKFDAHVLQTLAIRFRARTHQIIDAADGDTFATLDEAACESAAHETRYAGDQNLH